MNIIYKNAQNQLINFNYKQFTKTSPLQEKIILIAIVIIVGCISFAFAYNNYFKKVKSKKKNHDYQIHNQKNSEDIVQSDLKKTSPNDLKDIPLSD